MKNQSPQVNQKFVQLKQANKVEGKQTSGLVIQKHKRSNSDVYSRPSTHNNSARISFNNMQKFSKLDLKSPSILKGKFLNQKSQLQSPEAQIEQQQSVNSKNNSKISFRKKKSEKSQVNNSELEMENQKVKAQNCPLNDPDIPPVSDNDHLSLRCFCKFCKCDEHFCPGWKKLQIIPRQMYKSVYKNSFKADEQQMINPLTQKIVPGSYLFTLKNQPQDLKSVKQTDFQCFEYPPGYNPKRELEEIKPKYQNLNQSFICSTSYQQQFIDYGPIQSFKFGAYHLRRKNISFNKSTVYKETFQDPKNLTGRAPEVNLRFQSSPAKSPQLQIRASTAKYTGFAASIAIPFNDKTEYRRTFNSKRQSREEYVKQPSKPIEVSQINTDKT